MKSLSFSFFTSAFTENGLSFFGRPSVLTKMAPVVGDEFLREKPYQGRDSVRMKQPIS